MLKSISILGSTGSIGVQTLEVAKFLGIKVNGLSANRNIDKLEKQVKEFKPELVSMGDEKSAIELSLRLKNQNIKIPVYYGDEGNCSIATIPGVDMVVAAMVGVSGLQPVLKAIQSGKDIALANKETLVAAGKIVIVDTS